MKTRIVIMAAAAILTGCAGGPAHASPPPNPAGTPNQPVLVPPSVAPPAPIQGPSSRGPSPAWVPTDRPQDLGGLLGGSQGGSFLPYYLETLRGNTPPDNACTAPTDVSTLLAPCDQPDR